MGKVVIGILAHVDAGKTTLSEAMLYSGGSIRKMGRVDNRDAFLDTYALERERGITIFSKQAELKLLNKEITLLDTPGHVDFSAEMERTLQVIDYAVLVISGADGVQGHTQTLWYLLKKYQIPTFLFINKMDQSGTDRKALQAELKKRLNEGCICFDEPLTEEIYEEIAMCDEDALEQFLQQGIVEKEQITELIKTRKVFPCYFGSALKLTGVEAFMQGLDMYTKEALHEMAFGAKVFKIARDEQGARLTYLRITGGSLKVKEILENGQNHLKEKVNQIRIYSGNKYESIERIEAGSICAVTGLTESYPGEGLGAEAASRKPVLEPVLTYQVILPEGCDAMTVLPKLRQLEEEEPELHIVWNESLQEIQVQLMGEVQTQILKHLIKERFGITVTFGMGNIVYRETIANTVEGVGHFEPLRHYAEVHLIMEPGEPGSGIKYQTQCSVDMLDLNWQRLILTHLQEREHKGVLTGSAITDLKITLAAGRAHNKHTEGGDFRQATYRAVRQGLKQAESVLLEPYYSFRLEVPDKMVGRAIADIERMQGTFEGPQLDGEMAILIGSAPVLHMRDYQMEVAAYTKGHGRLFCTVKGYQPCHNTTEVIAQIQYDEERDIDNPSGSVFCSHGAGYTVPWDQVTAHMHIASQLAREPLEAVSTETELQGAYQEERWIDTEEVDAILNRTFNANKKSDFIPHKGIKWGNRNKQEIYQAPQAVRNYKKPENKEEYLLVDGYNIVYAWEDLRELAEETIDGARGKLLDILCNYQAIRKCNLIVVFDAYRVAGHQTEILDYHNIHVVYTKEAETADQYIEKFAHENRNKYHVVVATSDGVEQIIIRGQGCGLMSARELQSAVYETSKQVQEMYDEKRDKSRSYLLDNLPKDVVRQIKEIEEDA